MTGQTVGQRTAADVSALLRARNSLLWVVTREEARVERSLFEAAAAAGYGCRTWDVAQGAADINGTGQLSNTEDPNAVLNVIRQRSTSGQERSVWIMRDLPTWLNPPVGATTLRQLRNLARTLPTVPRDRAQAIIVITPVAEVPVELSGHTTVIEWPLPDREEIASILDAAIAGLPEDLQTTAAPNGTRDSAIDAAIGLSGEEAASCYARSLVQSRKIDPAIVSGEKKRIIAREGMLEWYDPLPDGLDAVGGLENLKSWLTLRKSAYTRQAREYGLPAPKGTLLVGVPGCGKSLTAKAIATAWGVPLLRVDLGALKSKFVGESERNLRKAFSVIETIGRCVVWFDEIEKALQGSVSGSADGGVSSDALGAILTWMQDRRSEAFIVATANDVEGLPEPLLRKGRFDELFFVDVPTPVERVAILKAALKSNGRSGLKVDLDAVSDECEGFIGAEIAALVPDAMFSAFNDGAREIKTGDLIAAAQTVVPLTKTASEKIDRLRKWAVGNTRPASKPAVSGVVRKVQNKTLDID